MTLPLVYVILLHAWERERTRSPEIAALLDEALRIVKRAHVLIRARNRR